MQISDAVHAMDLSDRSESTASHFSHGLPQAQPQTSRFEQVFAQSQVRPTHSIPAPASQYPCLAASTPATVFLWVQTSLHLGVRHCRVC